MDAFIKSFSALSKQLLPIVGLLVLVCLAILIIKLIKVLGSVDSTVLKTHKTIDLANESIEKVQAPLDTVVKVSNGVDKAFDVTAKAVNTTKDFVVKNAGDIKDKVTNIINRNKDDKTIDANDIEDSE